MITQFSSTTIRGDGRGTVIGFPTINLAHSPDIPAGVYACTVLLDHDLQPLPAVMHLGLRPTFNALHCCEIHVIHAKIANLPNVCTVHVISYIRPTQKFADSEELKKQIAEDINTATLLLYEKNS